MFLQNLGSRMPFTHKKHSCMQSETSNELQKYRRIWELVIWLGSDLDTEQISVQIFVTGCYCFKRENLGVRGHLWKIKSHLIIWQPGLWCAYHLHCQSPQIHSSLPPFHPFSSLPISQSSAHGWNVSVIAFSWFACEGIEESSTVHLESAFFLYVAAHRGEQ